MFPHFQGDKFWRQQLTLLQEISEEFIDHHELAKKLFIKRPPAGLEQERGNAEATQQTDSEKQVVPRGRGAWATGSGLGSSKAPEAANIRPWKAASMTQVCFVDFLKAPWRPSIG